MKSTQWVYEIYWDAWVKATLKNEAFRVYQELSGSWVYEHIFYREKGIQVLWKEAGFTDRDAAMSAAEVSLKKPD